MKELFLVEGESAASTVRQAMYKPTQCVHACQGKLINVERATANQVCQKIFQFLGCGIQENCNIRNLSFSRILILTDPGVDGVHARLLLLKLFELYLKPLITSGVVSVILPPLFRITDLQSSSHQYAWDESQKMQQIKKISNPNNSNITQFRGIAQFSVTECRQLLLYPDTRKQINLISSEISNA